MMCCLYTGVHIPSRSKSQTKVVLALAPENADRLKEARQTERSKQQTN